VLIDVTSNDGSASVDTQSAADTAEGIAQANDRDYTVTAGASMVQLGVLGVLGSIVAGFFML
jgi:hypothetical protein